MLRAQLSLVALAGITASAVAAGSHQSVRGGSAQLKPRKLQEDFEGRCFRDDKSDRVFSRAIKGLSDNTAESCASRCQNLGGYAYYALQYGEECWCSEEGTVVDRLGELDASECAFPCTGDSSTTCGGRDSFQPYVLPDAPEDPENYIGCFADVNGARVFAEPLVRSTDANSREFCQSTCSGGGFAYYGLQYGVECFCGTIDEDYALYGESTDCTYFCPGEIYTCGGFNAMDVYLLNESATPAPVEDPTPAPVAPVESTFPPASSIGPTPAPPTPAPVAPVGPTPAPAAPVATPVPAAPVTTPVPAAPVTTPVPAAPVTTPVPAAPVTTPVPAGPVDGDVLVDLVPCLLSSSSIDENSSGLYMLSLFFQGFWTSKTEELVVSTTDDLSTLLVDTEDTVPHGKCNAVYIGYAPSAEQVAALTAYSVQYKVRIVYLQSSLTHSDSTEGGFQSKLGISTYFAEPLTTPSFFKLSEAGGEKVSITQSTLQTDPNTFDTPLYSYPVIINTVVEGVEILAEYVDADGVPILSGAGEDQDNAAMLTYTGTDGSEEMHVFFTLGWFDTGSWPWVHYIHEWATKGIFMGERRFYLGAVVDDLFLSTPTFEYDGAMNEAAESRCTGGDLTSLLGVQDALNAQYPGSQIITEFAMNGGGIAEQVSKSVDFEITYVPAYEETMVTTKGTKWSEEGQGTVHDINWLATNVPIMQADMDSGLWEENDELLAQVIEYLDTPNTFYHQHHTLIHLSRDQLRSSDCITEDTGNVQIALMTGMWDSDNYNWRSMVSPGITGLFNEFCLESAAANLMTCYPGDNTFDGTVPDTAILTNPDSQFHSIYTTVSNNGYDGAQIVPRFATYVYFNCVTGDCLVKENEYIRRFVCECEPLDPSIAEYTCSSTADQCVDADGNPDIRSLGSIENVFNTEAATTTRYMLTGRRDKYMFHQANIRPAGDVGDGSQSLLDYWYERVMEDFSEWITFPVKTVKFDDLCTDFKLHEALDSSEPYATMALDGTGAVTGFNYVSGSGASLVPLTVPAASAASIPTTGLTIVESETYGTDTTYYLRDDGADEVERVGSKPDASELAAVPDLVSEAASDAVVVSETSEVAEEIDVETAEAQEENALVPAGEGGEGKLGDEGLVDAEIAVEYLTTTDSLATP